FAVRREITVAESAGYTVCQVAGALVGVWLAHAMFDIDILQVSGKLRSGAGQWLSEAVATFGLLMAILATLRYGTRIVAVSVGLYISAAYWFTASTSFANPAVTLGRTLTDSFSGIHPSHALAFIAAQLVGAILAVGFFRWLLQPSGKSH
ncbi:MAG: aquaporin, partial [Pseudomonadota bacterium]